ncbi:MAG: DUF1015 domain-containing protein [Chitinispirillales bacterium]|jgi:uncharacterized protein (DUF1015 family)|nr:DUF1015 domain-containing protein [Chitinispirillales bacterium]
MADVKAFRGYRFAINKADELGAHCAPPYDMIDEALIDTLYAKDPHNVVRITQNRKETSDSANKDRHVRAAAFLKEWIDKKIIVQDDSDSVYIYRQQFTAEQNGQIVSHERTGICVLVKLVDFEEQVVLPHEYTLSGPKQDRYELMETTNANTGLIFGLATDDNGEFYTMIRKIMDSASLAGTFTDENGVVHTLYRNVDTALISQTAALMKSRSILIADGHHRYETALRFYRDRKNEAFSHVMMTLVSMADPGLVIRPFHRLVRKSNQGRVVNDMKSELAKYFDLEPLGKISTEIVNETIAKKAATEIVFWDSASGDLTGLRLNVGGEEFLSKTMPERSGNWKRLDVSKINAIIINGILELPLDGHVLHDIVNYANDVSSGALPLTKQANDFYGGFFIRPVSISVINETVKGGERMPQKSTNFFPKLYSGLVFNKMM